MEDNGIIAIRRMEAFTLLEVQKVLPIIKKITSESSEKSESLMSQLDIMAPKTERSIEIEKQLDLIITSWNEKIKKLGAEPKGLWLVDFDCGNGYFCWKYPEPEVLYWHKYEEGFTNRKPIDTWTPEKINSKNDVPELTI